MTWSPGLTSASKERKLDLEPARCCWPPYPLQFLGSIIFFDQLNTMLSKETKNLLDIVEFNRFALSVFVVN